jgi:hypothetical protein
MITYEILEDNIKFIKKGDGIVKIGFILRLTTTNAPVAYHFHNFKYDNEWTIPYFDYTGCGIVTVHETENMKELFRVIIPEHFNVKSKSQNIIAIGLNKTGTSSLNKDLVELGYSLFPEPIGHQFLFPDICRNDYHSTLSSIENPRYNLYQDLPTSLPNVYKEIYKYRPDDIYILTIRENEDKFVSSCLKFYEHHFKINDFKMFNHSQKFHYNYYYVDNITLYNLHYTFFNLWGINNTDNLEQKLKEVYNKHNNDVIEFFKTKPNSNFIVIDVSKKGELKKLTNWLNIKNDKQDFSWENKSK